MAIVWNLITETNGAPEAVWDAVREHVRTDPGIFVDASDELAGLWAEARPHARERVEQARRLVNDVLLAVGDVARDRWRDLSPVARGLVVLVARDPQVPAGTESRRPPTPREPSGGKGSTTPAARPGPLRAAQAATQALPDHSRRARVTCRMTRIVLE